ERITAVIEFLESRSRRFAVRDEVDENRNDIALFRQLGKTLARRDDGQLAHQSMAGERVTRLELATSSLARRCSTTELHPRLRGVGIMSAAPLDARSLSFLERLRYNFAKTRFGRALPDVRTDYRPFTRTFR